MTIPNIELPSVDPEEESTNLVLKEEDNDYNIYQSEDGNTTLMVPPGKQGNAIIEELEQRTPIED